MKLSVGDIFWLKNPAFPSTVSHPHIVIAISNDRRIFYVSTNSNERLVRIACSRAEDKRAGRNLNTMVTVDPAGCPALDHRSYVNGNQSYDKDEYSLTRMRTFKRVPEISASDSLLREIRKAVLSSRATKSVLRNLLLREMSQG